MVTPVNGGAPAHAIPERWEGSAVPEPILQPEACKSVRVEDHGIALLVFRMTTKYGSQ